MTDHCNPEEDFSFAAVGDVHGHIHEMVRLVLQQESRTGRKVSFILQAGDFEPHRDEADLHTMAAPAKYKVLGDFHDFHRRRTHFPWPVYFIGGNHEPYGFLEEIPQGREVAGNCHYLGRTGLAEIRGLKIAGVSGIYSPNHFNVPRPPRDQFGKKSNKDFIYFTEEDILRAGRFGKVDILLIHEWPAGMVGEEDLGRIERQRLTMRYESVGNEYVRILMEILQPRLVICGHMHMPCRRTLLLESGSSCDICCLASVQQGPESAAIYAVRGGNAITEIL